MFAQLRNKVRRTATEEIASAPVFAQSYVKICHDDTADITLCTEIVSRPWNLPYMPRVGETVILPISAATYRSAVGVVEKISHQTFLHDGEINSFIWCREMVD